MSYDYAVPIYLCYLILQPGVTSLQSTVASTISHASNSTVNLMTVGKSLLVSELPSINSTQNGGQGQDASSSIEPVTIPTGILVSDGRNQSQMIQQPNENTTTFLPVIKNITTNFKPVNISYSGNETVLETNRTENGSKFAPSPYIGAIAEDHSGMFRYYHAVAVNQTNAIGRNKQKGIGSVSGPIYFNSFSKPASKNSSIHQNKFNIPALKIQNDLKEQNRTFSSNGSSFGDVKPEESSNNFPYHYEGGDLGQPEGWSAGPVSNNHVKGYGGGSGVSFPPTGFGGSKGDSDSKYVKGYTDGSTGPGAFHSSPGFEKVEQHPGNNYVQGYNLGTTGSSYASSGFDHVTDHSGSKGEGPTGLGVLYTSSAVEDTKSYSGFNQVNVANNILNSQYIPRVPVVPPPWMVPPPQQGSSSVKFPHIPNTAEIEKPVRFEHDIESVVFTTEQPRSGQVEAPSSGLGIYQQSSSSGPGYDVHSYGSTHKMSAMGTALKFLATIVPLGLFVAALNPTVIHVNATQSMRRRPQHLGGGREINDRLPSGAAISGPEAEQCDLRGVCEATVKGTFAADSATIEESVFRILAHKFPKTTVTTFELDELFSAIRRKSCDSFTCESSSVLTKIDELIMISTSTSTPSLSTQQSSIKKIKRRKKKTPSIT